MRGNSVFLNGELGIDAGEDGVTPNDTADALLPVNFPEVEETIRAGGSLVVKGCVVAGATIDVYEASADPSGFGEGLQHLGAIVEGGVLDDDEQRGCSAENDATFSLTVETGVTSITLTATSSGRTSEFSPVYSEAGEDPDPGCDTDASCQAPTPVCNPVLRRCAVCIDDADAGQVDSGCDEGAPLCVAVADAEPRCSTATGSEPEPDTIDGGCSLTRPGPHLPNAPGQFLILVGFILAWRRRKW